MSIDWQKIVTNLEGMNWSLVKIAEATGSTAQSISDIKHGRTKQPVGNVAVRLWSLHKKENRAKKPATRAGL